MKDIVLLNPPVYFDGDRPFTLERSPHLGLLILAAFVHERAPGFCDHAITGEAETVFLASLLALARGEPLPQLQRGDPILNLDEIPFPDHSLTRRRAYGPGHPILLSRGCSHHCYFCARVVLGIKPRSCSIRDLIEEIRRDWPLHRGRLVFVDDTFNQDRELMMELCRTFRRERLGLRWFCNSRVDTLDEEMVREMKAAGCTLVGLGVEAGSERVRREVIRKGSFTNQDIRAAVAACRRHKLDVGAWFILGHPTETWDEIQETRELIFETGFYGVSVQLLMPYPGTRLYEIAHAEGLIDLETIDRYARGELGAGF